MGYDASISLPFGPKEVKAHCYKLPRIEVNNGLFMWRTEFSFQVKSTYEIESYVVSTMTATTYPSIIKFNLLVKSEKGDFLLKQAILSSAYYHNGSEIELTFSCSEIEDLTDMIDLKVIINYDI